MRILLTFLIPLLVSLAACDAARNESINSTAALDNEPQASVLYQCPMHPHFTSTNANDSCPICGMSLVQVDGSSGRSDSSAVVISVEPEMIQTMGVRTVEAKVTTLDRTLRAFGTVETNERRENVTVSRLEGWIDSLRPRAEGDAVQPGSLLYRIYSPDLIAAQKDYVNSLAIGNDKRIASVGQRLKSLGMQDAAFDALRKHKKVVERVPVYAEAGGIVAQLDVREGDYVKPGTPIMRLQSYESVWVIASIPEQDLALVTMGLPAKLEFPSAPGAAVAGEINYIYPTIDAKTRTAKVRIEVDNALGFLRPGAYADIQFDLTDTPRLSIPTEAVLRDSRGSHVILALGEGRFTSRSIETGINTLGRTEVIHGLEPGERVVTSAQFLLDSEVNLREGLSKLGSSNEHSDEHSGEDDQESDHAGHQH